jgi:hypothetical protein
VGEVAGQQAESLPYYFLRSLRGEPDSLDINKHLTLYSLHSYLSAHVDRRARSYHSRQRPGLEGKINGDFLFADFSAPLMEIEGLELGSYPIRELSFLETEKIQIKKLLTRMQRSPNNFSEEWLEKAANFNLGDHVQEQFGRLAAKFAKELSFSLPEVTVDDTTIFFPDGSKADHPSLSSTASKARKWLASNPGSTKRLRLFRRRISIALSPGTDDDTANSAGFTATETNFATSPSSRRFFQS